MGRTGNNQTFDIGFVISDEMLGSEFANFTNIIVTFLFSDSRKSYGRLTTTTMLLRKRDHETLEDFFVVALECCIEYTITVDDNKAELLVVLK